MIQLTEQERNNVKNISSGLSGEILRTVLEKYIESLSDTRTYGELKGDDMRDIHRTYSSRMQAVSILEEFLKLVFVHNTKKISDNSKDYI